MSDTINEEKPKAKKRVKTPDGERHSLNKTAEINQDDHMSPTRKTDHEYVVESRVASKDSALKMFLSQYLDTEEIDMSVRRTDKDIGLLNLLRGVNVKGEKLNYGTKFKQSVKTGEEFMRHLSNGILFLCKNRSDPDLEKLKKFSLETPEDITAERLTRYTDDVRIFSRPPSVHNILENHGEQKLLGGPQKLIGTQKRIRGNVSEETAGEIGTTRALPTPPKGLAPPEKGEEQANKGRNAARRSAASMDKEQSKDNPSKTTSTEKESRLSQKGKSAAREQSKDDDILDIKPNSVEIKDVPPKSKKNSKRDNDQR